MLAIAGHVLHNTEGGWGGGGGGERYLTEKREGEEPLSLTFIGRLMSLEIVANRAIFYSLNTIPLCYKCMMQAAENFTLGRIVSIKRYVP